MLRLCLLKWRRKDYKMARSTSVQQYAEMDVKGVLGREQARILDIISRAGEPLTDKEISAYNDISINAVTGRRNELLKKGLIRDAGTRPCNITGNNSHIWTNNSESREDNGQGNHVSSHLYTEPSITPVHPTQKTPWPSNLPPEYCRGCGRDLPVNTGAHYCKFCIIDQGG